MIKKWKVGAVATMAAVLMTTAGLNVDAAAKKSYSRESLKTNKVEEKVKKSLKDYYKEGEVIVMYGDKSKKMKAFSADELGADIEVSETYTFDVNDQAKGLSAKAAGSNTTGNIHFSLVKSDKYSTIELMNMMKNRSDVKSVSPNWIVKASDTDYSDLQWALGEKGTNADVVNSMIKENESDGKEKVIAVVDTGVDYTHPDLADKMWTNPIPDKMKGEHGYDFVNSDADPMDDDGHGTHCSGIAAGNHDGNGISGIVDSDNVKIMALKMLDENGHGEFFETVGCYNYIYRAQQNGVNIVAINNSWGVTCDEFYFEYSTQEEYEQLLKEDELFVTLIDLVGENGAISVCAAGNEGVNTDNTHSTPSDLNSDYIVSVAASDESDDLAEFSNYGAKTVDLAAPGVDIMSSVSYENFDISLYSQEKIDEVCAYYETFTEMTEGDVANSSEEESSFLDYKNAKFYNVGNEEGSKAVVTAERSSDPDGKSLAITFSGLEADKECQYAIPFKTPSDAFYFALNAKLESENPGEEENEDSCFFSIVPAKQFDKRPGIEAGWGIGKGDEFDPIMDEYTYGEGGDVYLVVNLWPVGDKDVTVYLDDIAITKSTEEDFGKYAYYSGTSMATPAVTGAVAALAELNPEMSALERKDLLLGCVRPGQGRAATETITGGILDLSKINAPGAFIKNVSFVDESKVEITGSHLENAKVTINETEVTPIEKTDNKIVLDAEDYINKAVVISVENQGVSRDYEMKLAAGEELEPVATMEINAYEAHHSQFVSDGVSTYVVSENGQVIKVNEDGQNEELCGGITADILGKGYESYVAAGDKAFGIDNNCVSLNGEIYAIAALKSEFETAKVLTKYTKDNTWVKVADIPTQFENRIGMTLAAYNGNIYVLGGVNTEGEFSTDVSCLNVVENTWSKVADLPSARAFSKSAQTGNKLVVAFGAKDKEATYPEIMTFDGEKWAVSDAKVEAEVTNYASYEDSVNAGVQFAAGSYSAKDKKDAEEVAEENNTVNEEEEPSECGFDVYYGNIAPVKDGVILQNVFVSGFGNIVKYNVADDSYERTGYKKNFNCGGAVGAVALNDKFIIANTNLENISLYSMPIENGMVSLDVTGEELVDITKTQDAWLPCDTVSFTAKAKEGCEIESFTVGGQKIEANEDQVYAFADLASNNLDGVKVEVKGAAKEEPKQEATTEAPKKPATTQAPKPATTEAPKKPATTQAPSSAINVPGKLEPAKLNSKVQIDGITYKVTNADTKNGTVSCVKFNNKRATSVVIPDTVQYAGVTYKVTKIADGALASAKKLKSITIGKNVTVIGKNVCKKCKKLTKVTIKSSNIKSIGKGSFKSINKKATITVPKSKKIAYTKKLKKAGCKATIK